MADARIDPLTYADAGVDIGAGDKAVTMIKSHVQSTYRHEVVGDIGGFGGLFAVDWARYNQPLLVSSTDGVGTKSHIAQQIGCLDTIGIDLVAMSADDVAVQVDQRRTVAMSRQVDPRGTRARDREVRRAVR